MISTVLLDLLREARRDEQAFMDSLDPGERDAAGRPDRWSAKDHLLHIAFWREQLASRLEATLAGRPQPEIDEPVHLNPVVFEEYRYAPWADVLAYGDRAAAACAAAIERFGDDDLVTFGRFDWVQNGQPLLAPVLIATYEHAELHLAQFHRERGDGAEAMRLCERWTARAADGPAPDVARGFLLYDLACYQATHGELAGAAANLDRAFTLTPGDGLRAFAETDPDLEPLRAASR